MLVVHLTDLVKRSIIGCAAQHSNASRYKQSSHDNHINLCALCITYYVTRRGPVKFLTDVTHFYLTDVTRLNFFEVARAAFFSKCPRHAVWRQVYNIQRVTSWGLAALFTWLGGAWPRRTNYHSCFASTILMGWHRQSITLLGRAQPVIPPDLLL